MSLSDLEIFFVKPNLKYESFNGTQIGSKVKFIFDESNEGELPEGQLVLIGVCEGRGSGNNIDTAKAPDTARRELFTLKIGGYENTIFDFGNIHQGDALSDSHFALKSVLAPLLKKNNTILILGGSQDLTYAAYQAYQTMEQTVNIVSADARIDIGEIDEDVSSANYLGKIIMHQPNFLFNYCNIGYQSYYVDQRTNDLMNRLFFDTHRLGELKEQPDSIEALVRNADLISFDISSIRFSDCPASADVGPNGFNGEEACRISRYAGLSDKVSLFGVFEFNPSLDNRQQSAKLIGQMLWYFLQGYFNRIGDFPVVDKALYHQYNVFIENSDHNIIFYKSNKSDRWWMEIPFPTKSDGKYERHYLVPCTYNDYLITCQGEIPDRWWKTYQKLN